jgi:hypothetical protein
MGTVLAAKTADKSAFQGRDTESIERGGDEPENVSGREGCSWELKGSD